MSYKLRVIVEKVNTFNDKVESREEIAEYKIENAKTILEVGLRHSAQIQLLKKVQDALLREQSILFTSEKQACPQCGLPFHRRGYKVSDFHAVFSDHKLKVQRLFCKQLRILMKMNSDYYDREQCEEENFCKRLRL